MPFWKHVLGIPLLIFALEIGASERIVLGDAVQSEPSSAIAERLIAGLSSPGRTAEDMEEAEAKLQEMAPQVVIPLLVPRIAQGMPGGGIWNSLGSAKGDAKAPPKWRAFYSHHRVWDQVAPRDAKLTAQLLAKHLSTAKTPQEQGALISQIETYWDDSAEKPIASIMRRFRDDNSSWLTAAACLLRHKRGKYDADFKQLVKQLPADTWQTMNTKASAVELLLSERATARRRNEIGALAPVPLPLLDPELLAIGFGLLNAMEGHKKGFGYFLAVDLGDYVGQDFQPNRKDGNYEGANGLKEEYFADYSQNALDWWEKTSRPMP